MGGGAARDTARRRGQPRAALGGSRAQGGRHAGQPRRLGRRTLPAGASPPLVTTFSLWQSPEGLCCMPQGMACKGCQPAAMLSLHAAMSISSTHASPARPCHPGTQVSEWVQRILAAGDAFAGPEGGRGLRALLAAQSGRFFAAYHVENMDALHSMLEKELWHAIPAPAAGTHACSLSPACLQSPTSAAATHAPCAGGATLLEGLRGSDAGAAQQAPQHPAPPSFEKLLAAGNPWRRKHLRRRLAKQGPPAVSVQLGWGCSWACCDTLCAWLAPCTEF